MLLLLHYFRSLLQSLLRSGGSSRKEVWVREEDNLPVLPETFRALATLFLAVRIGHGQEQRGLLFRLANRRHVRMELRKDLLNAVVLLEQHLRQPRLAGRTGCRWAGNCSRGTTPTNTAATRVPFAHERITCRQTFRPLLQSAHHHHIIRILLDLFRRFDRLLGSGLRSFINALVRLALQLVQHHRALLRQLLLPIRTLLLLLLLSERRSRRWLRRFTRCLAHQRLLLLFLCLLVPLLILLCTTAAFSIRLLALVSRRGLSSLTYLTVATLATTAVAQLVPPWCRFRSCHRGR